MALTVYDMIKIQLVNMAIMKRNSINEYCVCLCVYSRIFINCCFQQDVWCKFVALFVRRKSSKVFARIRSMKVLSFPTDEASCGDDDDFSD